MVPPAQGTDCAGVAACTRWQGAHGVPLPSFAGGGVVAPSCLWRFEIPALGAQGLALEAVADTRACRGHH
eukprot:54495-Chlamydomonas_euryale.AAC.1